MMPGNPGSYCGQRLWPTAGSLAACSRIIATSTCLVLDMCDTYDCSDSPSRLKEATEQLLRNFDSWAPYK